MSKPINYYLSQPISDELSTAVDNLDRKSLIGLAEIWLSCYHSQDDNDKFVSLDGGYNVYPMSNSQLLQLAYGALSKAV